MTHPLVSTDWLALHLSDPDVRVVDVRWYLLTPERKGVQEYLAGHIPGAVHMDVDRDLASIGQGPGRHPLPRREVFAEAVAHAGINPETHVIAYDDSAGASAARLWWLLRYYRHDRVSLLDGGIPQWIKEGRPLESGTREVPRGTLELAGPHREWVVDQDRVARMALDRDAQVIDSRVGERYRGEVEPLDPRAGHVPGALNAPLAANQRGTNDLRFRPPGELRARFQELGIKEGRPPAVYCGSGINACANILALELAGFDGLLYEGSWSDWSSNPERPAATGAQP